MIEAVDNGIQLMLTGICTAAALVCAVRSKARPWFLLGLFSGVFFLGDLYWMLYLVFYQDTPQHTYISDLSWDASYLFLILLLLYVREIEDSPPAWRPQWSSLRRLWPAPVFTVGMCAFFMTYGNYVSNIVAAVLMTGLLVVSLEGLRSLRGESPQKRSLRPVYVVALIFCAAEYGMWICSCFWEGDSLANPYFWFDLLLSLTFLLLFAALRKAVAR